MNQKSKIIRGIEPIRDGDERIGSIYLMKYYDNYFDNTAQLYGVQKKL